MKMNLSDQVLEKLASAAEPLSGEQIARELFVSRNAVWKAVKQLREQGYRIEAATNRGYVLAADNRRLCAAQIAAQLENGGEVLLFDEVDSTNAVLKQMADAGAPEGLAVVALRQTAGRGRRGRSFLSPEGGIYFSLLLRPAFAPQLALYATAAAAVAVCRAIEQSGGAQCRIKWVNDVYMADKKVCGILTEGAFDAETEGLRYAVVGIGINLTEPPGGFAPEIADRAAAVFGRQTVFAAQTASLAARVINTFWQFYTDIEQKGFLAEYRARSWLDGKTVTYERGGTAHSGMVLGIDEQARLLVRENGVTTALSAGDVSVRY